MASFFPRPRASRTSLLPLFAPLLFVAAACAQEDTFGTGGSDAGGDSSQGGNADGAGGVGTGASPGTGAGPSTGGMAQGGNPGTGGTGTGGMGTGGMGTGGGASLDDYPLEMEPNDTIAKANGLAAGTLGFSASLSASDVDTFYFDAPLGSTVRVAISDGLGGCPAGANVTLAVYDPSTVLLTSASGLCPVIDGTTLAAFNSIPTGGVYFAQVDPTNAVGSYVIEIEVSPPVCGDNVVQLGEQCDDGNNMAGDGCENDCTITPACGDAMVQVGEECDDGNMMAGDGCDASCLLEGNYCPEGEPNNTYQTATPITVCEGGQGQIAVVGDLDFYAIDVPAGGSVRAEVVDLLGTGCPAGFDSQIRLYDSAGTSLGSDDDDGTNACSLITPVDAFAQNLAAGTYYVSVEEFANNGTSPPYVLLLSSVAPSCGDGLVQMGEQCDDGNNVDGDGCTALCAIEGNFCPEMEANNTYQTSNPFTAGCDGMTGALSIGDIDFYAVTLATTGSIKVESFDATGVNCSGIDSVVRLYNAGGTQLGSNDDGGVGTCSLINPAVDSFASNLAAGTYYVSVEEYLMNDATPPYVVRIYPQ